MKYEIDAKNKSLGRLASEIAHILQGKKSASYNPRLAGSDSVEVVNIKTMKITGKKLDGKLYHKHTGYIGNLKTKTLRTALEKNPSWVLRSAVYNMLPKNRLRKVRMKKLNVK